VIPTVLQASGVYLSDIPRYDLSSDYILLAEQRQAEADLKEKYERLSVELQVCSAADWGVSEWTG
jgi:guanylate cyclase soluble subunit beta